MTPAPSAPLANDVNLLLTRLLARIDPAICWERFVGDTGSEQVNRSVRIFWDAVALGVNHSA